MPKAVTQQQKAIAEFNKMAPLFETFAQAVYGKRIPVKVPTKASPEMGKMLAYNDGETIYIIPPLSLGDTVEHDRLWCGTNNSDGVAYCPACKKFEGIFSSICHEIAHFTGGSFISREKDALWARQAKYANPLWGAFVWNILEDIRIENLMFRSQVGTKTMRFGTFTEILLSKMTEETPLNNWAVYAILANAMGYKSVEYPKPVQDFISDPAFERWIELTKHCSGPEEIVNLVPGFLEFANQYKLFANPEDLKDEEQQDDPEGNSEQDDSDQEDESESDESGESEDASQGESESNEGESPKDEETDESLREDDRGYDVSSDDNNSDTVSEGNDESDSGPDSDRSSGESSEEDEQESGSGSVNEDDDSDSDESNGNSSDEISEEESEEVHESGREENSSSDSNDGETGGEDSDTESNQGNSGSESESSDDSNESAGSSGADSSETGKDATAGLASETSDPADGTDTPSGTAEPPAGNLAPAVEDSEPEPSDNAGSEAYEESYDIDLNNLGDGDDATELLRVLMGHSDFEDDQPRDKAEFLEVATAYEAFQEDAGAVTDLVEFKYTSGAGWHVYENGKYNSYSKYNRAASWSQKISDPEKRDWWDNTGKLESALSKMRIVFAENDKSKTEANRRSGKVNTRTLGKRAPINDDRLFKKKFFPKKRDYAVLIMVDMSGSTRRTLPMILNAVIAQADLLTRLGVKFSIVCHTATSPKTGSFEDYCDNYAFVKIVAKDWNEPWSKSQLERTKNVFSYDCNLDGHAMLYARKEILKQKESDRLIMYYTDGLMPVENHDEELRILKQELKILNKNHVVVAGVGIGTDSPTKHGLPTVRVNEQSDIPKVVDHLEKLMLEVRN